MLGKREKLADFVGLGRSVLPQPVRLSESDL
jgi:hypothetical protein